MAIALPTTILRIHVRSKIVKAFGLDDWWAVLSQALFVAFIGLDINALIHGIGYRRWQMSMEVNQEGIKYYLLGGIVYCFTTASIKITIGLFLLRFVTHPLQILFIRSMNLSNFFIAVSYSLFLIFTCSPVSFFWDLDPNDTGFCYTPTIWKHVAYFVASANCLADFLFATLPAFIIFQTSMSRRTKIGVSVLLGLGSFAVVATVIRTVMGKYLIHFKQEFLFDTAPIAMLSYVECGLGIFAANMATLRPLFKQWQAKRHPSAAGQVNHNHSKMPSNIRFLLSFRFVDSLRRTSRNLADSSPQTGLIQDHGPASMQVTNDSGITRLGSMSTYRDMSFCHGGESEKKTTTLVVVEEDLERGRH
ncbi:Hypothetical protein D9617_37g012180 [Elsinoe fawcettii]|nr:Hypothetical protein D9617_37g012180 [Elsinoe fawcettii]